MKKQMGFTLVELVVVIAVLGILAATALPRFINVSGQARVAAVNGVAGGMRSGVGMAQAAWAAAGSNVASVTMADGTVIAVSAATGWPTGAADGIGRAVQLSADFTADYTASPVTFTPASYGSANCRVTYDPTTGEVTAAVTCG